MKKIIPYTKDITFKTNIAAISSISLEHEEKIYDNEVAGEFAIFGDYKIHNDTTEKELFKYKLPFAIDFIEEIEKDSVVIEIDDFNYEIINDNILRVNIKFSLTAKEKIKEEKKEDTRIEEATFEKIESGEEKATEDNKKQERLDEEIFEKDSELEKEIDKYIKEEIDKEEKREDVPEQGEKEINEEVENEEEKEREDEIIKPADSEFVIYHIHIVSENETLEEIIKKYECTLEDLRMYNEITNINIGDKIIIPEKNE